MPAVQIENLNHEGRGVAHLDGKTLFIEGALPAEIVTFGYTRRHPRFDEAIVDDIIQASSQRITPACEYFNVCNGCQLQHMPETMQIAFKQQALAQQLIQAKATPQHWLAPLQGETWHYRHKGRLSIKYVTKKQALLIGFHEKSGRFVADMQYCRVLHQKVAALIKPLRIKLRELSIYQKIAQIEIAVSEPNQVSLILRHLADLTPADKDLLQDLTKHYDFVWYLQPNPPAPITCLSAEAAPLFYTLPAFNLTLQFLPQQFTQINPSINEKMITQALNLLNLQPTDQVLDLFCGIGNFTLPLARYCQQVVGVEGDVSAIAQARVNAHLNHLTHVNFYVDNLFAPQPTLPWLLQNHSKVLLDPPRTGALEILPFIQYAQRIVYVSCNPATLARDAGILVNQYGFTLQQAGVMDMFPHTRHVESMALFVKSQ